MAGGFARLAGNAFKAFSKGLGGSKVAADAGRLMTTANRLGQFQGSAAGNYVTNTVIDAGMGMMWGESPGTALLRSGIGNVGGTVGQKVVGKGLKKLGASDAAIEAIGAVAVNPLAYSATEMAGMRVMPGLYGLDAQGNYVGDSGVGMAQNGMQANQPPAMPDGLVPGLQPGSTPGLQPSLLSPADKVRIESDHYFREQRKNRQQMKRIAASNYRQQLELGNMGQYGMQSLAAQAGLAPVPGGY
jgi:hypothetical protein